MRCRTIPAALCALSVLTVGASAGAEGEAEELTPGAGALRSDVVRVVASYEEQGWFIDQVEYTEIEARLLESACRTTVEERLSALHWFEERRGAPPERLYHQEGGQLTAEVRQALTREREWVALTRTLERMDECPFYIEPSAIFAGRQTERDKWVVHLEGGGVGEALHVQGRFGVGGGGNGRLLLGRGIEDSVSLLAGGEVGGGAELNASSADEQFTFKYTAATPLVLRLRDVAWLYDFEAAPVAMLQQEDFSINWGGRVGFAVGLSTLRVRDFLPWAGVAISFDHYFAGSGRPATQLVRAGLRVGIRWLP